ncbi:MAG: T9SS type A sorting domain-containing protein, partial [Parafilimonas sp.]
FVVDYWDHEIGHQFGANHTFDYAYEGTIAQLEPGSGSTIMGYAGATGNQDLDVQKHSDPYFHGVSIQQITNYIINGSGASCAQITSPGDIAPTANAGADYTIPKSTPFQLTGMATDADASDVLTYCWEQFDVYKKGGTSYKFPDDSSTTGPVFRSYLPDPSKQRIIPKISSILDGTNENKWEVLPTVARDVSFRLTVRDNHAGNGSTANDNVLIKVTNAAGPFLITKPSADTTTYNEGNNLTVTWNVANTTASPVNCSNVNILLSIDGGITFPYTVAASTPNDGSEQIIIPIISSSTTKARIKVEAVGNIFFDISNSDLKIKKSIAVDWLFFTAEKSGNNAALLKWSTASEMNNDHFEIERSKDKITFTAIANVPAGNFPNQTQNYSYTDNTVESGINYYRLKQVSKDSSFSYSGLAQVTFGASWSIQPNPATDNAKIIFSNQATNIQIALSDAAGKMVYHLTQQSVNANDVITIPVNNLATGVYFLRIITGADSRTERIFVSH